MEQKLGQAGLQVLEQQNFSQSVVKRGIMSPASRKFDCKVVGKWIDGWIFKQPKLSVEILEDVTPKFIDIKVSMAMYHAAKNGAILEVPAKETESGTWIVA